MFPHPQKRCKPGEEEGGDSWTRGRGGPTCVGPGGKRPDFLTKSRRRRLQRQSSVHYRPSWRAAAWDPSLRTEEEEEEEGFYETKKEVGGLMADKGISFYGNIFKVTFGGRGGKPTWSQGSNPARGGPLCTGSFSGQMAPPI